MRQPTIIDVAREAGVAFKTVARVINGDGPVKQGTRERVEAAIVRLGYKSNVWARSLRSSRSQAIAMVLMPTSSADAEDHSISIEENLAVSSYFNRIQVASMARSQNAGYHLFVEALPSGTRGVAKRVLRLVEETKVDGVLLTPPLSDNADVIRALKEKRVPFVRISPHSRIEASSSVYFDERRASYELTRHICALGHRDIAYVKGPPDHLSSRERFLGFEEALKDACLDVRPEWVVERAYSMRFGAQAAEKLMSKRRRPTAIVCFNDDIAAGVMTAAYRKGLTLPRDLSIAGFDNSPIAAALWPGLTTIYQPVGDIADAATAILIREIENPNGFCSQKLDYRLIIRDSTASVRRTFAASVQRRQPCAR